MFLEEDKLNPRKKISKAIKPHTYIISFVLELVLCIIARMVKVVEITLDNNQYLRDWLKTHWVTIKVRTFDTFYAIAHV
jgi:hypothetical protein